MKIIYLLMGAILVAAAGFAGGAYWEMLSVAPPTSAYGQVVSSSATSITVSLANGQHKTFVVGPQTSFLAPTPVVAKTSGDATVGSTVQVFPDKTGGASVVQLLPQSPYDPEPLP